MDAGDRQPDSLFLARLNMDFWPVDEIGDISSSGILAWDWKTLIWTYVKDWTRYLHDYLNRIQMTKSFQYKIYKSLNHTKSSP